MLAEATGTLRRTLPSGQSQKSPPLEVGQTIEDFELVAVLGSGAFSTVFLARQTSLGRFVALKVTANVGGEARTMASLDHDYIVKVFSETVLADRNLRLLCMQFVPGTTLGPVIERLAEHSSTVWTGAELLAAIDRLAAGPTSSNRPRSATAPCSKKPT